MKAEDKNAYMKTYYNLDARGILIEKSNSCKKLFVFYFYILLPDLQIIV